MSDGRIFENYMVIACFLVFSSSPPCLTQEVLCHFWHKSFVTSPQCKSIFPNSSPASAVPPWNCISELFCDVSFVLSLWDRACPQTTSLTHGSASLLPSKPFDAHCCCQQPAVCLSFKGCLKLPFPAVLDSLGILSLLIRAVLKALTALPVQGWLGLDKDVA